MKRIKVIDKKAGEEVLQVQSMYLDCKVFVIDGKECQGVTYDGNSFIQFDEDYETNIFRCWLTPIDHTKFEIRIDNE